MADGSSRDETIYDGIRFRSRLAARWAVLFDVLGSEYLYEPQAFKVGATTHSPSFLLPELGDDLRREDALIAAGVFIDVQPTAPSQRDFEVSATISEHTDRDLYIFYGPTMTRGLEWYTHMKKALPRFFSQCPFCGRFGVSTSSVEDGEREGWGSVHTHACMEEHKVPEKYNVLGHCSQDLRITAHSPALDIAYEEARTMRFGDSGCQERAGISRQAVQAIMSTKSYCTAEVTEWIIANALKWAQEKSEWMRFDGAPWWIQHKKDLDAGVSPCTCYSCVGRRKDQKQQIEDTKALTDRVQ